MEQTFNGSNADCDISLLLHAAVLWVLMGLECLAESAADVSSSMYFVCAIALAGNLELAFCVVYRKVLS
jgi:hypothetical protein